jgi:hypothetical protein
MVGYEVVFKDKTVERIFGADAYAQEGPMTTFFERAPGRQVVDCWSNRVASLRTQDILIIRREAGCAVGAERLAAPSASTAPDLWHEAKPVDCHGT